jgi:hypothetical protein
MDAFIYFPPGMEIGRDVIEDALEDALGTGRQGHGCRNVDLQIDDKAHARKCSRSFVTR